MYQTSQCIRAVDSMPAGIETNMFHRPPTFKNCNIRVSVFGNETMKIRWPRTERVGLVFDGRRSPINLIEDLLEQSGFRSPEELRPVFAIPPRPLTCRLLEPAATEGLVDTRTGAPEEILRQALILGLCGPDIYDPDRPVIWTRSRLTRKADLFEVGDFYADN